MELVREVKRCESSVVPNGRSISGHCCILSSSKISQVLPTTFNRYTTSPSLVATNNSVKPRSVSCIDFVIPGILFVGTTSNVFASIIQTISVDVVAEPTANSQTCNYSVHGYMGPALFVPTRSVESLGTAIPSSVPIPLHQPVVNVGVDDCVLVLSERNLSARQAINYKYFSYLWWSIVGQLTLAACRSASLFLAFTLWTIVIISELSFVSIAKRLSSLFQQVHNLTSNESVQLGRTGLILS